MLVKAVAHHTTAAFIRVVGSESVQKCEVQRILLELLNQMDGFNQSSNVKVRIQGILDSDTNILSGYHGNYQVIIDTNRVNTLDPALLRPGPSRLHQKIEIPLPSRREKHLIFQTVTGKMNHGPRGCTSTNISGI
jgi:26S proteasome regulatory subunit T3